MQGIFAPSRSWTGCKPQPSVLPRIPPDGIIDSLTLESPFWALVVLKSVLVQYLLVIRARHADPFLERHLLYPNCHRQRKRPMGQTTPLRSGALNSASWRLKREASNWFSMSE